MTHPPFDAQHRRAWDSIPWFVAGSASADDSAHLQAHLPHCEDCRSELAFHQRVQRGLNARAPAQNLPDAEAGLQRLLARAAIDRDHATASAMTTAAPRAAAAPWTRWLVAAVLVQAVALGAAMLALFSHGRDDGFQTLSQPAPAATPGASVRLVPAPTLDFAALQALLQQTGMVVVDIAPDGSHLGLAARDGDAATAAAALPRLRALPGVRLAEPTAALRGAAP